MRPCAIEVVNPTGLLVRNPGHTPRRGRCNFWNYEGNSTATPRVRIILLKTCVRFPTGARCLTTPDVKSPKVIAREHYYLSMITISKSPRVANLESSTNRSYGKHTHSQEPPLDIAHREAHGCNQELPGCHRANTTDSLRAACSRCTRCSGPPSSPASGRTTPACSRRR